VVEVARAGARVDPGEEPGLHGAGRSRVLRAPERAAYDVVVEGDVPGLSGGVPRGRREAAMSESLFDVDASALERRVIAAIDAAAVNRFEVEFEWPECHAKRCSGRHGDPRQAFAMMKHQIVDAVQSELRFYTTTRPDVAEPGDTAEDIAALTLAVLLGRYNVHDAGTWARAARLLIDAYPALVPALANIEATS
jgi:hypothetical protein